MPLPSGLVYGFCFSEEHFLKSYRKTHKKTSHIFARNEAISLRKSFPIIYLNWLSLLVCDCFVPRNYSLQVKKKGDSRNLESPFFYVLPTKFRILLRTR